ncbi:MAG: galactonate dehydratase, partial [Gaiellales bacterium]|nr:galactonate dehydratase [Gaiellales bacterium]
ELAEFLVGTSPRQIEHHWQTLRKVGFFRGGSIASSAAAAIDCALWDIAGRTRGAPVYELVGGPVCDAVRAFASIGDADEARDRLALRFTAFTLRLSSSDTGSALLPLVEAVRARIGPGSDLAIDCGGQLSLASAPDSCCRSSSRIGCWCSASRFAALQVSFSTQTSSVSPGAQRASARMPTMRRVRSVRSQPGATSALTARAWALLPNGGPG